MKKNKNIKNIRTCIFTNKRYLKSNLIRVVKLKNGTFEIDINQEIKGRGAYFHLETSNLDIIIKKKMFNKVFRTHVDIQLYLKLEELKNGI